MMLHSCVVASLICCFLGSSFVQANVISVPSDDYEDARFCQITTESIVNLTRTVDELNSKSDAVSESVERCERRLEEQNQVIRDIYDAIVNVTQDCSDIKKIGNRRSGVYNFYVPNNSVGPRLVYCDLDTSGRHWLVFQRRKDGSENFERTWHEYASGFGNLHGEFWLGNDALHVLTNSFNYKLRVELEDFEGQRRYAEYATFKIGSPANNYRLTASGYSGDAGDNLSGHSGYQFSTKDADHDTLPGASCALQYRGAWWYSACHASNLNGAYLRGNHTTHADGVEWYEFRGHYYSLKSTEMKISRV